MNFIKEHVSTQYNDLEGNIAIDLIDGVTGLYTLCENHNIDISPYFIVGFKISEFTTDGVGRRDTISCYIYVLDKSIYGDNFDDITKEIMRRNGEVNAKSIPIELNLNELGNYIKRFDFLAMSKITRTINHLNINEDES